MIGIVKEKVFNLNQGFTVNDVVVDTEYLRSIKPYSIRDHHQNFDRKQKVLFNYEINGLDSDIINVEIFKTKREFKNSGNLQMDNHRMSGLNDPQNSTDVVNKQFVEN